MSTEDTETQGSGTILRFEGISKAFGGLKALHEVTGTIPHHRLSALVGPNGAGKTTLVNTITGFVPPDSGRLLFHERDITAAPPHVVASLGIGRTFQDLRLFGGITVLDNVMVAFPGQIGERLPSLFARWRSIREQERAHRERALDLLDFVGLAHKRGILADNLSYGQQKRLALARALACESDFLLLDEPSTGLDPPAVSEVGEMLSELVAMGKTVCMVEHNLELVADCADWVIGMGQGRILVEGASDEVLANRFLIESYIAGGGAA